MTQAARLESLEAFRQGSVGFLLATDVAARGLDILGVQVRCLVLLGAAASAATGAHVPSPMHVHTTACSSSSSSFSLSLCHTLSHTLSLSLSAGRAQL